MLECLGMTSSSKVFYLCLVTRPLWDYLIIAGFFAVLFYGLFWISEQQHKEMK